MIAQRQIISLNGTWQYKLSLDEGRLLADNDGWQEMPVPSNWHLAGLPNHAGVVYFRRSFSLGEIASDKRIRLRFAGVDYLADVWLNGVYLGHHEGYFGPFEFDVTQLVRDENTLIVKVDSPLEDTDAWPDGKVLIKGVFAQHDCRPGAWHPERGQDGNTGGIWNDVSLIISRATRLEGAKIAPLLLPDGSARLRITVAVSSPRVQEVELGLRITPANFAGEPVESVTTHHLGAGTKRVVLVQTMEEPRLWWPWDQGEPNLYNAKISLLVNDEIVDEVDERFGIRELRIDEDRNWILNGQRVFPRGTNIISTQWLSEYTSERIAQDISLLREANVNAVRVHAHVNREEFYAACDEAGFMVWQDFALLWDYEVSDDFCRRSVGQIREMVELLYNHASIVVWNCHNEPHVDQEALDHLLWQAAREADVTRPVEMASHDYEHPYPGWYYGHFREFSGLPGSPLVTEFGAQALPNLETMREIFADGDLYPPNWESWAYHDFQYDPTFHVAGIEMGSSLEEFIQNSQAYQARLLRYAIESYRRAKYKPITGIFQFMFVDCWPSITWSVLDYYRRPKAGYHALQQAYQPLLVSIRLRREVLSPGTELEFGLTVVNDLPQEFADATVRCWIEGPDDRTLHQEEKLVDIPADGVVDVLDRRLPIPGDAPPGRYRLRARLISAPGRRISYNELFFTLTRNQQRSTL
ncbi:MAG: glycoside hydrolase family 2 protein [Anaerolineae bacterium]